MKVRIFLGLLLLSSFPSTVFAQASDNLVESIMALRSEVETLYTQLQDGKQDHRANMRSLAAQKADLEAQMNRQNISLQQLALDIEKTQVDIDRVRSRTESIKPTLLEGQVALKELIAEGLPFKLSERIKDVVELGQKIEAESLTEERALGQLWAGYEDIIRMTRENGLFKQEIELDGRPILVEVAKIGTVALYFRTPDDVVGYAIAEEEGAAFKVAEDAVQQEQIRILFDSMEKQIRTGNFVLPGAFYLPGAQP